MTAPLTPGSRCSAGIVHDGGTAYRCTTAPLRSVLHVQRPSASARPRWHRCAGCVQEAGVAHAQTWFTPVMTALVGPPNRLATVVPLVILGPVATDAVTITTGHWTNQREPRRDRACSDSERF